MPQPQTPTFLPSQPLTLDGNSVKNGYHQVPLDILTQESQTKIHV